MDPYALSDVMPVAPTKDRRRRRWFWLAGVLVLVVGGAYFTYRALATSTVTITGTIQVTLPENEPWSSPCTGMGGYSDLQGGAQVVVTDAAGSTVAVGQLQPGIVIGVPPASHACQFQFTVDAPGGHSFYGVEISHRGRLQYARTALAAPLALTLG